MKLKKIASLMLAGIMAVSMLAGCSGKGDDGKTENPIAPVPTGVVAMANDAVDADAKEDTNFTGFAASTNLDSILKDLASSTSNFDQSKINKIYNKTTIERDDGTLEKKLNGKLEGLLDADGKFDEIPADNSTEKYGYIYTISGKVEQKVAVAQVVKEVEETLDDAETVGSNNITGTSYDATYGAEISVVKVSSSSASDESAWVVAVVLTQTVAKVSNTVQ